MPSWTDPGPIAFTAEIETARETTVVTLDAAPRMVEVPADLSTALAAAPKALVTFEALSHSHRREYVQRVTGAKREQTSRRRIEQTVKMLAEGRKRQ